MSGALTLIVFVAAGDADDASSRAMLRATRSALGARSHVEIRATREPPDDDQVLAAEQQAHADAVAELTWSDAAHRQARLHVHLARTGRWVDRSIGFQSSDADSERGRTIGFAMASMIPEAPGNAEPEPVVSPQSPSAQSSAGPSPPVAPAPTASAPTPSSPIEGPSTPERAALPPDESARRAGARPQELSLDVVAIGAAGQGGDVDGVGAAVGGQWTPLRLLAARVAFGARAGSMQVAQSTTLTLIGTAGLVLRVLPTTPAHRLGVWLRADYVLERQSLTHFSGDEPSPVTLDRWMSGMDALVGVDWMFAADVGLIAGAGAEDVFSPTYVQLRGAPAGTLPALRGIAEAGFRIRF